MKNKLRKEALIRRDNISEDERISKSKIISDRLFSLEEYDTSTAILSYASFRSEVVTEAINKRVLEGNKLLFLPRADSDSHEMDFFRVKSLSELKVGYMGIKEPEDNKKNRLLFDSDAGWFYCEDADGYDISQNKILVLMPVVGYDLSGNRLGYGGGYYDRFLSRFPELIPATIGLAFSIQRLEKIEAEENDIKPSKIITD